MIEDAEGKNATQERMPLRKEYLDTFTGSLQPWTLYILKIQVEFNTLSGAFRRPLAHTCTPSLKLPPTYATYTKICFGVLQMHGQQAFIYVTKCTYL